jgi:hypothetical protein
MLGSRSLSASAFSESPDGPVSAQGVAATGSVGSVVATGDAIVSLTGVSGTSAVGSVIARFPVDVSVTGISGTTSVGAAIGSIPVSVSVTGVGAIMPMTATEAGGPLFGGMAFSQESFSSLADGPNNIIVLEGAGAILVGVEATGAVGAVAVSGDANVGTTGLSATASVDSVSVTGKANVSPTGIAATGTPGTVTVVEGTGVNALLSSPRMQGQVGIVAPNAEIKVFLTGVSATGQVTPASVVSWNEIIVNQDPNWVEIAA